LIFTGGSNGTDLVRDGRELRDIHILSVENRADGSFSLSWSTPIIFAPGGENLIPGRCHTASLCGSKIIYFGGSAEHTSEVVVLDLLPSEASKSECEVIARRGGGGEAERPFQYLLHSPFVDRRTLGKRCPRPWQRLSHVSFLVGTRLIIQGGFSKHFRELGDVWSCDLAHETSELRPELLSRQGEVYSRSEENAELSVEEEIQTSVRLRRGIVDEGSDGESDGGQFFDVAEASGISLQGLLQGGISPEILQMLIQSGMFQGGGDDDDDDDDFVDDYEGGNDDDEDYLYEDEGEEG